MVQSFQKIGPLQKLAPTQSEPPFVLAQSLLLLVMLVIGWIALKRFRHAPVLD